jgi:hypothetical protein
MWDSNVTEIMDTGLGAGVQFEAEAAMFLLLQLWKQ